MVKFNRSDDVTPQETDGVVQTVNKLSTEEIARIKAIKYQCELPGMTLKFGAPGEFTDKTVPGAEPVAYDESIKIIRGKNTVKFSAKSLLSLYDEITRNTKLKGYLEDRAKLDEIAY